MAKFLGLLGDNDRMVLGRIREAGEAWIVGGWVRDAISGSMVRDLDIATTLKPDEIKDLFPRSLMVGEKYGTVSVRLEEPSHEEVIWEVTTLRGDGGYGDGRRPDNVEFGKDIEFDLARRDFTINAMAIDESGELIDPFGGVLDLDLGLLRAVGEASERIGEDGLRIMRAFRFLDWGNKGVRVFEEGLSEAICSNSSMLDKVSKERIWSELSQILSGTNVGNIVSLMHYHGVLGTILPGIAINRNVDMSEFYRTNLALICSEEERSGAELVKELSNLLRISKEDARVVSFLHDCKDEEINSESSSIRRFRAYLRRDRREEFVAYSIGMRREMSEFLEALASTKPLKVGNSPLVDGTVLSQETGLEPSKRLGRLKAWLHRRQIEEDMSDPLEVLSLLEEFSWSDSDPDQWPKLSWP